MLVNLSPKILSIKLGFFFSFYDNNSFKIKTVLFPPGLDSRLRFFVNIFIHILAQKVVHFREAVVLD